MSIGPWYMTWTYGTRQVEYASDANTPGRWRPVSYRRVLFGVIPLTWWRKVGDA